MANAPLKVTDMSLSSVPGRLTCALSMIGIPDLLALDKASYDYREPSSSTKTVKALITEIASGDPVSYDAVEQQLTDGAHKKLRQNLYDEEGGITEYGYFQVGQRVYINNRTVTKLSFCLQRVGLCSGDITFRIQSCETDTYLASKYLCDASAINNAQNAWYEVEFDTPVDVNEWVWLICEYEINFADEDNYIRIYYSPADVKGGSSECLMDLPYDAPGREEWANQDCRYKYTYQGWGIDCYTHCAAVQVEYDSEDSLIDSYMPKDSLFISENEDRLTVINRLLSFTGCEKRFGDDGKIHVFVPVTTGTDHDGEYSLAKGYHNFFSKSIRKALVLPNLISIRSFDEDEDYYTGSAISAESYALWPVSDFVRMKLTSNSQAASIAAAMISRLEVDSRKGSGVVPMNIGQEIYDYVLITDAIEGDSIAGNIGFIRRSYRPGAYYNMIISFGKVAMKSVKGTRPSLLPENRYRALNPSEQNVKWGDFSDVMTEQVGEIWDGGIHDGKEYAGINDLVLRCDELNNDIQKLYDSLNNVIIPKLNLILGEI
jgi:hypothetical protein